MTTTLAVTKRETTGKANAALRAEGNVPAVLYGAKEESTKIAIDALTFEKLLRTAGEASIITLKGLDEDKEVLIQDVAFDPVKGGVSHVDFYAIERGKELTTNVPLEFVGEAPAVKQGGSLVKVLHDVEVTCRPSNLPAHITVDVSVLEDYGAAIHVKDLPIGEGVTVNNSPDDTVASVVQAVEEAEEETAAVDMDAIEVEQKGKGEDAEGEAAAE
ncbi:MAG: 50S ribosomal protein L25 [Candidatus Pacebacteria bacterium]|nr:50S ribosomal protein L25 [Candidatus Paceibacterota bacterium]